MNRGLYAAATGMTSLQRTLDVASNNLANVNTTAFKRDGISFNDVMKRELFADGGFGPLVGTVGDGPTQGEEFTAFERGSLRATSNAYDIALDSDTAMFSVRTPNGETRYTRDGSLRPILQNGRAYLGTGQGDLVLDTQDSPIELSSGTLPDDLVIRPNGEVQVTVDGEVSSVGQIGLFEGQFAKVGGGLYDATTRTAVSEDHRLVKQFQIEGSNVNALSEMTDLVRIGRQFELTQKAMQTQDSMLQQLIQSLQSR